MDAIPDIQQLTALHEQELAVLHDAADRNLILSAFDFGGTRCSRIPARLALARIESLGTLEALVFCLCFGGVDDGLTRGFSADYLRLPEKTIARAEYAVVKRLGLVEKVA